MRYILLPSVILLTLLFTSGCYYDKFEDFKPKQACDTTAATYNKKIKPILDLHCNSCHASPATLGGGVVLDNYNSVRIVAESGKLLSAVTWDGKAAQMPKGAFDKIDECYINDISNWINHNYPQ